MAANVGRSVIIERNGVSLASILRTKTLTINGEPVNVETDGDNGWATTLDGVWASMNVTIALEGVLKDDDLLDMAFTLAHDDFTAVIDDLCSFDGTWQFQAGFSIGAPYQGETTFSGTLMSIGAVTKGAVT